MFKAELVCFAKNQTCQAYRANEFQQLSFVGSSLISAEAALEDAYKQAFEKHGITSDQIKRQKVWHIDNYERKLKDSIGFSTLQNNQYENPQRLTRQQEYAIKKARANEISSETL